MNGVSERLRQELETKFKKDTARSFATRKHAFIYCSERGAFSPGTVWGSYGHVYKDDLEHREYELQDCDGQVSVHYTDCMYHEHLHRVVMKPTNK